MLVPSLVRVARLCVKPVGRAQFPLLPRESRAACGCGRSKWKKTKGPTVLERSRVTRVHLFANLRAIFFFLRIEKAGREGGGAPDGHLGGGSSTAPPGRGCECCRGRDK